MIELVVFDMAGTTVYDGDAVNASFRGALEAHGVQADPAFVNTVMGYHKPEAIRMILDRAGRTPVAGEVETIHEEFVRRMCDYYANDPSVREIPGAGDVFRTLRNSCVKVALNTGFSRAVVDVLLNRLGWHTPGVIDASITSDEVPHGRPHPDMIQTLMERLGVANTRAVAKVGDTSVDLQEGTNAGCGLVIGVTSGAFTGEELLAFPHTHIVATVAEVPAIVLSQLPGKS